MVYPFEENYNQSLQRSAASEGTLLTGGTLRDLATFGQGLASTEYGNEWDRGYRMAALNAGISEGNAGRTLSGLSTLGGWGMGAAGGMGGAYGDVGYGQGYGTVGAQNEWNQGIGTAANTLGEWFAGRRQPPPPGPGSLPVGGNWRPPTQPGWSMGTPPPQATPGQGLW